MKEFKVLLSRADNKTQYFHLVLPVEVTRIDSESIVLDYRGPIIRVYSQKTHQLTSDGYISYRTCEDPEIGPCPEKFKSILKNLDNHFSLKIQNYPPSTDVLKLVVAEMVRNGVYQYTFSELGTGLRWFRLHEPKGPDYIVLQKSCLPICVGKEDLILREVLIE